MVPPDAGSIVAHGGSESEGGSGQRVVPAPRITDYARSRTCDEETLGFTVDRECRFEPGFVFAQVSRDGVRSYPTEHEGDCRVGRLLHLIVPDVDGWFAEIERAGATALAARAASTAPARSVRSRDLRAG